MLKRFLWGGTSFFAIEPQGSNCGGNAGPMRLKDAELSCTPSLEQMRSSAVITSILTQCRLRWNCRLLFSLQLATRIVTTYGTPGDTVGRVPTLSPGCHRGSAVSMILGAIYTYIWVEPLMPDRSKARFRTTRDTGLYVVRGPFLPNRYGTLKTG